MADRRLVRGIYWTPYGWRLYVSVRGRLRPKRLTDPDHRLYTLDQLKDERTKWETTVRAPAREMPAAGPFETDVEAYLTAVATMPSINDRRHHLALWRTRFEGRGRETITPLEIRAQLHAWRQTRSASACNKRRTALMSFYTTLNGKTGYNPVRDVPKFAEEEEPRDQSLWTIYRILALMPPSTTRARLRVFVWTGWPHKTLARLKEAHVDFPHTRAWITRRRKGKGHGAGWLPLLPGAVLALKALKTYDGFGPFSTSAMYKSFQLAVDKFNAHRRRFGHGPIEVRPYDIRHSFGTWVAEHVEDDRVLQELMLHSRPEQSLRYTRRATERRLAKGVEILRGLTTGKGGSENAQKPERSRKDSAADSATRSVVSPRKTK